MMLYNDYKANWPQAFDRINEWVEEDKQRYTYLNNKEQRLLIGSLITDDKDIDLSPQDLRDWMQMLIENPTTERAQTLVSKIYQANKQLIDGMFQEAREHLDEKQTINLQFDNDFRAVLAQ